MEDESPTLEVGFAINFGDVFGQLRSLDDIIGEAAANAVREFNRIETAASGVDFAGSAASVKTFGSEATRAGQDAKMAFAQTEKAGESLSRQLDKQIATFGMSREQIRALKVETAALAAEQQGLTELAGRLRTQQQGLADAEAAAAQRMREDADAVRQASEAYRAFNVYAGQKMAAYRDQQAAETAQAASADRLRARIDPLFTAQKRYDEEVRDARALLEAKVITEDVHSAAVLASGKALDAAKHALEGHTTATGLNRIQVITAQSAFLRFTDSVIAGRNPLTAFALEAHKGVEVLSEDDAGMAGGLKKVTALLTPMNIGMAAGAVVAITAAAAWYSYDAAMNRLATTAQGTGALLGASAEQLEANAEAAANASLLTVGAARDLVAAYASVARTNDVDAGLAAITKDFAAATGQDMKQAATNLKTLFSESGAGAEELASKYGLLSAAQAEEIIKLQEAGKFEEAQKKLLQDLKPAIQGAAEHLTGMALALEHIEQAAGMAYDAVGEFMSKYGQSGLSAVEHLLGGNGQISATLFAPDATAPQRPAGDARANATVQAGVNLANQGTGYATQQQRLLQLAQVNASLKAVANGAHIASDEYARLTTAQDQLTHATQNFLTPGQKEVQLAQLNDQIFKAKGKPDLERQLALKKANLENNGKLITSAEAQADAQAKADQAVTKAERVGQKHRDTLVREAEAQEAQVKNLYLLADAYGVSGAAALIAEARTKAQSQAIKAGADQDAAIDRQIRIAIAQRVSDAEKSAAAMRDQAAVQAEVNAEIGNGNVSAQRASELVRDRIADLPILAAIEAAQQRGLKTEADKATKALNDQHAAQAAINAAAKGEQFVAQDADADNRLASLREELRLIGATDAARVHALATIEATQAAEAKYGKGTPFAANTAAKQVQIADGQQALKEQTDALNQSLSFTADKWDLIARNVQAAGEGMEDAFGAAGKALGDLGNIYTSYNASRARAEEQRAAVLKQYGAGSKQVEIANQKFALETSTLQVGAWADAAEAAKGFFGTGSAGYKVLQDAEMAFRAVQFALSIRAIAQDAIETGSSIANSVARTASKAVEAVVSAISSLPFPLNIAAGAATIAALASIGVGIVGSFGGGHKVDAGNTGIGTVLGDSTAKSDSIKNALDALKNVDTLTNTYSREMAASLKSIDSQISGVAAQIVKGGDAATGASVATGFKPNAIGSVLGAIPLIGGFLSSLFGSKTEVTASGLYGAGQSLGSILASGYKGQTYSDVTKTSKFFGITTGHSYSTQYGALDPGLQNQFTLILKSFDDAIVAAAGPLGAATDTIQSRLNGFVVDLGKIDLKGLTGTEIEDKLNAVFGAAADNLAQAAFPEIAQFQKVGEGLFETLVRVSSTVEQVSGSLDLLGQSATGMSIAAKIGLADQFDSVADLTSAADAYFQSYYSATEQTAAKTAQMTKVFDTLGLTMPTTLDAFRHLVEAQDLTTTAGQATYATLLKLAPAFADLQGSLEGAKSAADIASEKADLQRQLLELQGDTAAVRALDLAKLDASNRDLQQQVWATQDAQDAAKAASDLADAWTSVGDSIMDEVKRIRGLTDTGTDGSFASLMGQFNAATIAARGGDQDAAKSLPGLSQSLLTAAAAAATSRQELDRIQAQTAASLEATYGVVTALAKGGTATTTDTLTTAAAAAAQTSSPATVANDDTASEIKALRDELSAMRSDMNAGNATIASNTAGTNRRLDTVTAQSGGEAVTVASAA